MRLLRLILPASVSVICLLGCTDTHSNKQTATKDKQITPDTIIGQKTLTDEMAGSAYRSRGTYYFVVAGGDTSEFQPAFLQSAGDSSVAISLNMPYKKMMSYAQRMHQLRLILPVASRDYDMASLRYIGLGRLIQHGDLAIRLTRQYIDTFGTSMHIKTGSYPAVSKFLASSTLAGDVNTLLKPYSKSVKTVSIEKLFFAGKSELLKLSEVETDTSDIPNDILDCMLSIELE